MIEERHVINVIMPATLKKLIIQHSDSMGITFSQTSIRLARIGLISARRLNKMKKIIDTLERSADGGVVARNIKEADTANHYIHLLKTLDSNIELGNDAARFSLGVPHSFYVKMKKEADKSPSHMTVLMGANILNGFIIVTQYFSYKKIISSAILNGRIRSDDGSFDEITSCQNFVNFLDELFAEVDGSQIEAFDEVKKKFFESL